VPLAEGVVPLDGVLPPGLVLLVGLVPFVLLEGGVSGIIELKSWREERSGVPEVEGSFPSLVEAVGSLGSDVEEPPSEALGSEDPPEEDPEPSGDVVALVGDAEPSGGALGSVLVPLLEEPALVGSPVLVPLVEDPPVEEVEFVLLDEEIVEALKVKVTTDPGRPGLIDNDGKGVKGGTALFVEGHDDMYGAARVITCLGVRGV
jgi:hypothetical protein